MRRYSAILVFLIFIVLTACVSNNSIQEEEKNKYIDGNETGVRFFVGDFIELDESDTYELSLYTTGGMYKIINLDKSEVYRMLKDIKVIGTSNESNDDVPAGGTTGGNILVVGKDANVRYNFKVTGQSIRYDGQFYSIESANDLAMFILETRILLKDYMLQKPDDSLDFKLPIDYKVLLEGGVQALD